jgi:putative endonuclease
MRQYYVYLMAGRWGTLYIGVTSDLSKRVWQHKTGTFPGFTAKYRVTSLVYYEVTSEPEAAIAREKQLKGWRRSKKTDLITSRNPGWRDLSASWYQSLPSAPNSS